MNSQFVWSQQTPTFSNYNYNTVLINPAHSGYYKDLDISLFSRGYFNPTDGSPRNIGVTINAPLRSKNVGLSGSVLSDQIGVTNTTQVSLSYAYKIRFDDNYRRPIWWAYNPHILSFGITGGLLSYNDNLLDLGITDDPEFQNNINALIPTVGIGALYNQNRVYVGIAAPNILGTTLASDDSIELDQVYYAYGGIRFFATRFEKLLFNPSIFFKYTDGAPLQVDFNTTMNYNNKITLGIGYRTSAAINCLIGFNLSNNIRFVYQYNQALRDSPLTNTHGIILSYRLGDGFKN